MALLVAVAGPASAAGEGEAPIVVSAGVSGSLGPEAGQTGEQFRLVPAGPWPERPVSEANKSGSGTAATRRSPTDQRLLAISTAQSDTEIGPESDTERRLVGRESSERVDGVVIALWAIAGGMTVMLVLFLWHTSPRRRLRLARRRSTQLYDGEADQAGAAAGAGSDEDGDEVDDAAAAMQDAEAVAVAAAGADGDPQPSGAGLPTAWEGPAAAGPADGDEAEPETEPVEDDSGPAGPVFSTAWEEPEAEEPEVAGLEAEESELPPVWEDEAERAGDEAESAAGGPADESPEAGKAAGEGWSGFGMRLRRTLGLD